MNDCATEGQRVRVWDPFVRAFHWSLVAAFTVAWVTPRASETMHAYAGYVAAGLVTARVVWGFAGSRYARFSQFVRSPRAVIGYLANIARGQEMRFIGHNPAGGAMIIALLTGVAGAVISGWLLTTDYFWGSEPVAIVHSFIVHGVLLMIAFHLAGVAVASFRHRENLPRAMLTGAKRAPGADDVA